MLLVILLIFWVFIWVMSSISVDKLIRYEHDNYYDEWKRDRRPRGMFYNPEDGTLLGYYLMALHSSKTVPIWIQGDDVAIKLYKIVKLWKKITKIYFIIFIPLIIVSVNI